MQKLNSLVQDRLLQHSSRFQIVRNETGSAYHSDCYNCVRCHISLLGKPAYSMEDEVGLGAEGMLLCEEILPRWSVQPAEMTGLTKKSEGRQRLRRQKQWNVMTFLDELNILFTISHEIASQNKSNVRQIYNFRALEYKRESLAFHTRGVNTSPWYLTDHMFVQMSKQWWVEDSST